MTAVASAAAFELLGGVRAPPAVPTEGIAIAGAWVCHWVPWVDAEAPARAGAGGLGCYCLALLKALEARKQFGIVLIGVKRVVIEEAADFAGTIPLMQAGKSV